MNDDFELPEGVKQVARANSEWSRTRPDLALDRNCQQPTRLEAVDHGLVEAPISKQVGEVAEDQVHARSIGKPVVEIHYLEATAVGDTGKLRQPMGEIDGHRGDVDSPDLHPPASPTPGTRARRSTIPNARSWSFTTRSTVAWWRCAFTGPGS